MAEEKPQEGGGVGLPIGTKIGKYEIREKLGVGGQAIVYKGYDGLLDRHVAIKQISPHLAEDPKFLERFRREAQIVARLGAEQPAIVTIHELIAEERGLFIVMEFVPGHSLETVLNDTAGPTETKAALQIIWRLAAGLNAVHKAGIIHRDLKPSNIIIGEGLRATITDFGISTSISGQTSMVLGTTKYMAPELFEGGKTVDGRADMYSLGFIAYEMLAGRPEFNEVFQDIIRDPHSEAMRWMKWHGNEQVQAPPLHEIVPAVPEKLSDIVARMMAKRVERRFESMEVLGRAIRTAFSPRMRAEGAAAKGETSQAEDVVLTDQADQELDLAPEVPATAPLPKSSLSARTKLVLLGAIVVTVIGFGVAYLVKEHQAASSQRDSAVRLYEKAAEHYTQGRFAEAEKSFDGLIKRFAGTHQGQKASVMIHLCRARQAVDGDDWPVAYDEEDKANKRAKDLLARKRSLEGWARDIRTEIQNFRKYRISTKVFRGLMTEAEKLLADKKFDEAKDVLAGEIPRLCANVTPDQDRRRGDMLAKVQSAQAMENIRARVRAGDKLAGEGNLSDAIKAYKRVNDLIEQDALGNRYITAAGRKEVRNEVLAKIERLQIRKNVQSMLTAAGKAESLAEKLALLKQAHKMQPSQKLRAKIQELELRTARQKALGLAAQAMSNSALADQAIKQLTAYLAKDPKNKAAATALHKLKRARDWQGLVKAGNAAFADKKYSDALKHFAAARKIRRDTLLNTKIRDCNYYMQIAAARRLRDQGEYRKAIEAFEKARKINPARGPHDIDPQLRAVKQAQRYDGLIAQGNVTLKMKKWSDAQRYFEAARKVKNTPEVRKLIADTKYGKFVAMGKEYLQRGDLIGAKAFFNRAMDVRKTAEVRRLLDEVDRRIREQG